MAKEINKKEINVDLSEIKNSPPNAVDIEAEIIAAMLVDNSVIDKVIELLKPEMFYSINNRIIYEAIISLVSRGYPVDIISILDELRKREELEKIGGLAYLTELTSNLASSANIEFHCKIIIEKYMLRELIKASVSTIKKCYEGVDDTFDILDDAEKDLFVISENKFKKTFSPLSDLINPTLKIIDAAKKHGNIPGLKTGYDKFDEMTGGFQKSDLIIIAARPGMGKTALALSIARNMAILYDYPVGFFSLEMTNIQIVLRLLSAEAKINSNRLRRGHLYKDEDKKLSLACRKFSATKIFIDDSSGLSVLELRAKARRLIKEHGVKIIFVDYLQLMQGPSNLEREREISFISRSLKALAKELEIPIVALAQLNRQIENRPKKAPLLSDLRESGSIEQDADMVCFIHNPAKYSDNEENSQDESTYKKVEIIIAKQRNGPTGPFELLFLDEFTRFENPSDLEVKEIVGAIDDDVPFA